MKNGIFGALVFAAACLEIGAFAHVSHARQASPAKLSSTTQAATTQSPTLAVENRKPVIVELFTSEGCSDCPPADSLLMALQAQQPVAGADVIPLEEHVDYWNHDGWVDPFSSGEWTERQRTYVAKTKDPSPYSPEMVVDGQWQFVGSRSRDALQAIHLAAQQPEAQVSIAPESADPKGEQRFDVKVGSLPAQDSGDTPEVWLAVTESGLGNSVRAGENAGKDLKHGPVVRMFKKLGVAKAGSGDVAYDAPAALKFKSNWKRENLRVVVFVQEKKSLRIIGAAETKLSS